MTGKTLQRMAEFIPSEHLAEFFPAQRIPNMCAAGMEEKVARFLLAYKDPAFGWKFASYCARHKIPLPPVLERQDTPVYRAYVYSRNPKRYGDDHMIQALALTSHAMSSEAAVIKSLLLSRNTGTKEVAAKIGWPKEAVAIYEKLFYNIADRKEDLFYIRSLVYPGGRLSQFLRKEFTLHEVNDVLARAGYDNGSDDVMYLAGLSDNIESMLPAAEQSKRLEQVIMGVGLTMARNGWLNQTTRSNAFQHARALVQAGKLGGETGSKDAIDYETVGGAIMDDLKRLRITQIESSARMRNAELEMTNFTNPG
jgi:hypothetical protein